MGHYIKKDIPLKKVCKNGITYWSDYSEYEYEETRYTINGKVITKKVEKTIQIYWLTDGKPRCFTSSQWIKKTNKPYIYQDYSNWDELDEAIKVLGGKKLTYTDSYTDDYGNGDKVTFIRQYYDMSSLFK